MNRLCCILLVSSVLAIVLCCKSERTSSSEYVLPYATEASQLLKIYPLNKSLPKDKSLMDISSILDFFQLSNLPDSLIPAKINKVKYYKGQYFILDSKYSNLIICNDKGDFISQVGKLGEGPGQYQGIEDFEIDVLNNQIILLSNGDKALLFYTLTGRYITKKKMPIFADYFFKTFNDGFAFYLNHHNVYKEPYNLLCLDSKLHITNRFFPFDASVKNASVMDVGGISISPSNISHLIQNGYSDTLYRLQKDSLIPYCEFDFGPSSTRMDQVNIRFSDFSLDKKRELSNLYNPYCETTDYLSYRIFHKMKFHIGFFSKNSNKTFFCDRVKAHDFLEQIFSCPIGVTDDDSFITIFDPELIDHFKKDTKGNKFYNDAKFKNSKIYHVIHASRDSTSPYILKYKMTF